MPNQRVTITDTDNRDTSTTWIWISSTKYVEIDPGALMRNVIENLPETINEPFLERFNQLVADIEASVDTFNNQN
jgi:hypothetical protein